MYRFILYHNHSFFKVCYDLKFTRRLDRTCPRCDLKHTCAKELLPACERYSDDVYFKKLPVHSEFHDVNLTWLDFSKAKVRYNGEVCDKLKLSQLIHDIEFSLGNKNWPLVSDVMYDKYTYQELRDILYENAVLLEAVTKI